jgi:hypothetical protein
MLPPLLHLHISYSCLRFNFYSYASIGFRSPLVHPPIFYQTLPTPTGEFPDGDESPDPHTNVMAAMTAVRGTMSDEEILETVRNFVGVEHRNQWVATVGGVHYYNNSIGSSPARTVATLLPDHVKVLLLIGEAASQIEAEAQSAELPAYCPLRRPG